MHDGRDSRAPTIAVLCNEGAEVEVLSTGSDLYVEFVANSERPGQGFKAIFQFQPLEDALNSGNDKFHTLIESVINFFSTVYELSRNYQ